MDELKKEDINAFNNIVARYIALNENDGLGAFKLMKESIQVYNRFSFIRCQVRKKNGRGQLSAEKDRLQEMLRILDEVHTDSRIIWKLCRENIMKEED